MQIFFARHSLDVLLKCLKPQIVTIHTLAALMEPTLDVFPPVCEERVEHRGDGYDEAEKSSHALKKC
ncbi:hypothetical protein Ga0080574_TMP3800 [Salipiger abyssi]|uniref:Uncharacterized protein n=1 Tax=Salipiger abyssi TaxID=1250539 RepID=A0A1P8UXK6_9RHOB|nr:hypothetical protein Ga0080574_TMP3800 [Salipiger abyssi]